MRESLAILLHLHLIHWKIHRNKYLLSLKIELEDREKREEISRKKTQQFIRCHWCIVLYNVVSFIGSKQVPK